MKASEQQLELAPEYETGRYRLVGRLLPESETWLAEDLEDPTARVVVKILPHNSDAIAARHLTETLGRIEAAGLNLPGDEGELPDGRPFLVYPYLEGSTLREFLNASGPLSLPLAGTLMQQLGRALGSLHAAHFAYGTLAPEHVIVQQAHGRHKAILLNAGIYRVTEETSASPGYLAPEQLAGHATLSSDVFSLGTIAAEILTGRRAFRYGSLEDLTRQQRIGIPRGSLRKLRSKIPVRVEEEIRRATSWDSAHRPSDIEVFASKLGEFLNASEGFPKRRLFLGGILGVALLAAGMRRCRGR